MLAGAAAQHPQRSSSRPPLSPRRGVAEAGRDGRLSSAPASFHGSHCFRLLALPAAGAAAMHCHAHSHDSSFLSYQNLSSSSFRTSETRRMPTVFQKRAVNVLPMGLIC